MRPKIAHEEWRNIPGVAGAFQVSSHGRVRRKDGSLLAGSVSRYHFVRLPIGGGAYRKYYVHRLIAEAFIAMPSSDTCHVNHRDGDKLNNHAANLEWATQLSNNRHAYRTGLIPAGARHHWSKLGDAEVAEIRAARGSVTQSALAEKFGVTQQAISSVQRGKCWNTAERCSDGQ